MRKIRPDTGEPVVQNVYLGSEIFHGSRMSRAADLQIDLRDGYRTSWQKSLGAIPAGIVVANMKKWSGDHCASDPSDTSGILVSNRRESTPDPSVLDIAPTVLGILSVGETSQLDGRALEFRKESAARQRQDQSLATPRLRLTRHAPPLRRRKVNSVGRALGRLECEPAVNCATPSGSVHSLVVRPFGGVAP